MAAKQKDARHATDRRRRPPESLKKAGQKATPTRFRTRNPDPSRFEPVRWLRESWIALGRNTLLFGEDGVGKGLWLTRLAAEGSQGRVLGEFEGGGFDTLIVSIEDDLDSTIGPRFLAADGDPSRLHVLEARTEGDYLALPREDDLAELANAVETCGARLIIFDPVEDFIDAAIDDFRSRQWRAFVNPLAALADVHDCAIVIVVHTNKSDSADPRKKVSGTHAKRAQSRSAIGLYRHPHDEERVVAVVAKQNLAARVAPESFRIRQVTVRLPGQQGIPTPSVADLRSEPDLTLAEIAAGPVAASNGQGTKLESAKAVLRLALQDGKWHLVKGVKSSCVEAGMSESTIERAKRELGVERKTNSDVPPQQFWRLPVPSTTRPGAAREGTGSTSQSGQSSSNRANSFKARGDAEALKGLERATPRRRVSSVKTRKE